MIILKNPSKGRACKRQFQYVLFKMKRSPTLFDEATNYEQITSETIKISLRQGLLPFYASTLSYTENKYMKILMINNMNDLYKIQYKCKKKLYMRNYSTKLGTYM